MPDRELRTAPLSLRIRPSLKATLQKLADADRRQLAPYIEMVLEQHAEEKATSRGKRR